MPLPTRNFMEESLLRAVADLTPARELAPPEGSPEGGARERRQAAGARAARLPRAPAARRRCEVKRCPKTTYVKIADTSLTAERVQAFMEESRRTPWRAMLIEVTLSARPRRRQRKQRRSIARARAAEVALRRAERRCGFGWNRSQSAFVHIHDEVMHAEAPHLFRVLVRARRRYVAAMEARGRWADQINIVPLVPETVAMGFMEFARKLSEEAECTREALAVPAPLLTGNHSRSATEAALELYLRRFPR